MLRSVLLGVVCLGAVIALTALPNTPTATAADDNAPQYLKFATEHFDIELDAAHAEYRPYVETYLELGYRLFQKYTRYDYNKMMNQVAVADVHKPRYFYQFPTSDNMWVKGFGGGLTAWNNSQMNINLVPRLTAEELQKNQTALSILWHELANGWANVYVSHDGKPTNAPEWFAAEGHAGFIRSVAMREIGFPDTQVEEYKNALHAFDQYLAGEKHDPGGVCHVILESIWQKYGWKPLRAVYDAIQQDGLRFPTDDAPRANGMVITLMSKAVGEDMTPFFEQCKVPVDDATRAALKDLPKSTMQVARTKWVPDAPVN